MRVVIIFPVNAITEMKLNLFHQIVIYLGPVLPDLMTKTAALLGEPLNHWYQAATPITGTTIAKFEHMLKRLEEKDLNAMIDETREDATNESPETPVDPADECVTTDENTEGTETSPALMDEPLADEISYEDFMKVDLRVARVVKAEHVEGADKLLKLTLSLGGSETRQVFAGIKQAYEPEQLDGRLVVMVANLAPRKMRFGLSEGMITAAGPGGEEVFMLTIDEGAVPGQRIH